MNSSVANSFTVISLLNKTTELFTQHDIETPRLDAEVLLAYVLKTDKTGLYLSLHNFVTEQRRSHLEELIARRIKEEPVAYLVGQKEFWSLTFKVTPAVMIPRPQTETLVDATIEVFSADSSPSILEIGTGSGAISIALATELPKASIIATDISFDALSVARENAAFNGVNSVTFLEGNFFDPVKTQRRVFDLIISNPPYVPSKEIPFLPPGIRDYEPHIAIDGGFDGLEYYRKVVEKAHNFLKPDGCLLLEVGDKQSQEVCTIISQTGEFCRPETLKDLSNIARVVKSFKV